MGYGYHGSVGIFESLGRWLACFVLELNEYLPVKVDYVEAHGAYGAWVFQKHRRQDLIN